MSYKEKLRRHAVESVGPHGPRRAGLEANGIHCGNGCDPTNHERNNEPLPFVQNGGQGIGAHHTTDPVGSAREGFGDPFAPLNLGIEVGPAQTDPNSKPKKQPGNRAVKK